MYLIWRALVGPLELFSEFVLTPVVHALGPEVLEGPLTFYAIGLGLWEFCAAVLGLLCYGAVLLVYAIVPAESAGGKQGNGSV